MTAQRFSRVRMQSCYVDWALQMIQRRIASAGKAKLLPTHRNIRRQDVPVVVTSLQYLWRVRQPRVEIGSNAPSGNIPWTFDIVALFRPNHLRVFRSVPARSVAGVSNALISLSALVSGKSNSITSSRSSSGGHGYGHRDESLWEATSAWDAGEAPMRRADTVGEGAGAGAATTMGKSQKELAENARQMSSQLAERTTRSDWMAKEGGTTQIHAHGCAGHVTVSVCKREVIRNTKVTFSEFERHQPVDLPLESWTLRSMFPRKDPMYTTDLVLTCPASRRPSFSHNQVMASPTTRPTPPPWCQLLWPRIQKNREIYTAEVRHQLKTAVRGQRVNLSALYRLVTETEWFRPTSPTHRYRNPP